MKSSTVSPCRWDVRELEAWARLVKLTEETIAKLVENEVDGSTLVTLNKEELQSELGIRSLPARRCLWDLIEKLRSQQQALDFSVAIDVHEAEIDNLSVSQAPDESGGGGIHLDSSIVEVLRTDAKKQRQIIEDHLLAHRIQGDLSIDQRTYEDSQMARREQQRVDELLIQSEYDRRYAASLAGSTSRPAPSAEPKTLFAACIDTCIANRINVAEALQNGRIRALERWRVISLEVETDDDDTNEEDDFSSLAVIDHCQVCYEENQQGFSLACSHSYCVDCMKSLLRRALRDSSLLPLTCCEIPIDAALPRLLLKRKEADILEARTTEMLTKCKMYCPSCGQFINLDVVDSSVLEISCDCGAPLCAGCKTSAHPNLTCTENKAIKAGADKPLLQLSQKKGWKQCPACLIMIEFISGCNHMHCVNCRHDFCYQCLRPWNRRSGTCSSGKCEVWDENRLIEAGEERVRAQEAIRGRPLPAGIRQHRVEEEMHALRANEECNHEWMRQNGYHGQCERCSYDLIFYAMVCRGACGSTVCYTCAHHRIPQRGWR